MQHRMNKLSAAPQAHGQPVDCDHPSHTSLGPLPAVHILEQVQRCGTRTQPYCVRPKIQPVQQLMERPAPQLKPTGRARSTGPERQTAQAKPRHLSAQIVLSPVDREMNTGGVATKANRDQLTPDLPLPPVVQPV